MINDIEIGLKYFDRVCVNIMTLNTTDVQPDKYVIQIFQSNISEKYIDNNRVDILFENTDFGFWKITFLQPQIDDTGKIVTDKRGNPVPDKEKTDTEIIPFTYPCGIEGFMDAEVRPYAPQAYVDYKKVLTGYELSFTKFFY